jgi:hypothetical protein
MKPTRAEKIETKRGGGGTKGDKKPIKKWGKGNKTLRCKRERENGRIKKTDKKTIKEKEPEIKVLAHELLVFTLSYLMLAPW